MASILANWWVLLYSNNKWAKMETTLIDTWGDYAVPVLLKTGTETVDGEVRDCGQLYILVHENPIAPPTPTLSFNNVKTGGDLESPDPVTLYQWGYYPPGTIPGGGYEYNGFRFVSNGVGNDTKGFYGDYYTYESVQEILDAIDNGDIHAIRPKVYFDVYINGIDKPSLFVNWTAEEDLSPVLLTPKVWLGCQSLILDNDLVEQDGLMVPNVSSWNVTSAGAQSYAGSYKTSYLSIMEVFEQYLNPVSKVEYWGFNGEPEFVRLYLRMDYDESIGDLYRVAINNDGSLNSNYKVPNSSAANYDTIVRIHYGEPDYVLPEDDPDYPGGKDIDDDGPGRYDPDNPPPVEDFEDHEGNGFDGNAVLTKTYAVTAATLQNIGQKLWTQSYFDVLKVQSNPIENIVSVKGLPMAFTGTAEEIKVGDIAFGINGDKVASVQKITIGTIKYMGKYGNYLDFAPYTKTKLNLPYIGLIELDPADLFNSALNIDYVIDLVTGQCMAILTLDGIPFMNVTGQMGFDIPITATDRVQTELRVASAAITAIGGAAGHMIGGDIMGAGIGGASSALSLMGADYTSQRTASPSPACASFANHLVYLLVDRPLYEGESAGYKHLHGYPCHKYMNLGSLSGFVAVDARTDINIAMTSEENAMLEQLLTQGIYI